MKQFGIEKRILALVVALALLICMSPVSLAMEPPQSPGDPVVRVDDFDDLPDAVALQIVSYGTPLNSLNLPATLAGSVSDASGQIAGVTWISSPDYDATSPGDYLFTAAIPEPYTLNGVVPPNITVTVLNNLVSFTFPANQGDTSIYLTEGVAVSEADLLAGVTATDSLGESVTVTIQDLDGLDLSSPALRGTIAAPNAYTISYQAGGYADHRQAFVLPASDTTWEFTVTQTGIVIEPDEMNSGKTKVTYGDAQVQRNIDPRDIIEITGTYNYGGVGVTVKGVSANITLDGVSLTSSATAGFLVTNDATVNLKLVGSSSVQCVESALAITNGSTLNILSSSTGSLTATGGTYGAGIECVAGSSLVISGGTVTAHDEGIGAGIGGRASGNGGDITITGGTVTANGGSSGAGIGGGHYGACGDITITGGAVTATGGDHGAGVGGGYGSTCGDITITGGTVTATGGSNGVGIGGGYNGACGAITISGGTTTATGGEYAAGIGSGGSGACGDITITDSDITATGELGGAGIGGGLQGTCGDITISGGAVTATGGDYAAGIGGGSDGDCGGIAITDSDITTTGGSGGAGIGGGSWANCGDITISGGTITATGGVYGAGIGGGSSGDCGDISIADSDITATGGGDAAGIGGGDCGDCGDITISGGTTTATGGVYGAGIGGGLQGTCGDISIADSDITATGGDGEAGIGRRYDYANPATTALNIVIFDSNVRTPYSSLGTNTSKGWVNLLVYGENTCLHIDTPVEVGTAGSAFIAVPEDRLTGDGAAEFNRVRFTATPSPSPNSVIRATLPAAMSGVTEFDLVTAPVSAGIYRMIYAENLTGELVFALPGYDNTPIVSTGGDLMTPNAAIAFTKATLSTDVSGTYDFGEVPFGSAPEGTPRRTVTVTNNGDSHTGPIAIDPHGGVTVVENRISAGLEPGASGTFTILPATLRSPGHYAGEVSISGSNAVPVSFLAEFTIVKGNQQNMGFSGLLTEYALGTSPAPISLTGGNSGSNTARFVSNNPLVATVNDDGEITLLAPGTFAITATRPGDDYYLDGTITSSTITVKKMQAEITLHSREVRPSAPILVDVKVWPRLDIAPTGTITLMDGETNLGVVALDENHLAPFTMAARNAGEYPVTLIYSGDAYCEGGSVLTTIDVPAIDLSGETVTVEITGDRMYTGAQLTPAFTVSDGGWITAEDYTVLYGRNVSAGRQTGSITITGQRNYAGTMTVPFDIEPRPLTGAVVKLTKTSFPATGLAIRPRIESVTVDGITVPSSAYHTTYKNNVDPGTAAKVVITAKEYGNFTGTAGAKFTITESAAGDEPEIIEPDDESEEEMHQTEVEPRADGSSLVRVTLDTAPDANGDLIHTVTEDEIRQAIDAARAAGGEGDVVLEFVFTEAGRNGVPRTTFTPEALALMQENGVTSMGVAGGALRFRLDHAAMAEIARQAGKNDVLIGAAPISDLPEAVEWLTGERPAWNITVGYQADGENHLITDLAGGNIALGIRYDLADGEVPGRVAIVYLPESGEAEMLPLSSYRDGWASFTRRGLSTYAVGYIAPVPEFTDTQDHWAKNYIDFAAARGLLMGNSAGVFAPDAPVTRRDFAFALGRLISADVAGYEVSRFGDVSRDDPTMPYIEWIVDNGIIPPQPDGLFHPDQPVLREDMAVMMLRYSVATDYIMVSSRAKVEFNDADAISEFARSAVKTVQQAGVMTNRAGALFAPLENATRAEAAAVLNRFVNHVIYGDATRDWVQDDAGQWQYINDYGKPISGWLTTANGRKHWFDDQGIMAVGTWVEVGGKWYYLDAEGALVTNATVGEYEVGPDGARK